MARRDEHTEPDANREGIDRDIAERAAEHRAEDDKKRHDYTVKDGHEGFSLAGLRLHGSAAGQSMYGPKRKKERAAEQAFRETLLASLMERLNARLEEIDGRIGELETRLEAEFGGDFLEDNARMYLGDAMPERPPGMSDAEWQALLRGELATQMLGPDGKVKDQYAHLDIALWLQEMQERDRIEAIREQAITYLESTDDPQGVQALMIAKLEMSAKVSGAAHAPKSMSAIFKEATIGEQTKEPAQTDLAATKDLGTEMGFDIG